MSDPITRLNAALEGRPVKSFIHRRSLWRVVGTIAVVGLSYGCGKDGSGGDATGPDPEPQNTIPIASAGADQNVSATLRVELDGSGSSDQDASSLTFRWSLTSVPPGSTAALEDLTTVQTSFVPDLPGA